MRSLISAAIWYIDHMAVLGESITGLVTTPIRWASGPLAPELKKKKLKKK